MQWKGSTAKADTNRASGAHDIIQINSTELLLGFRCHATAPLSQMEC